MPAYLLSHLLCIAKYLLEQNTAHDKGAVLMPRAARQLRRPPSQPRSLPRPRSWSRRYWCEAFRRGGLRLVRRCRNAWLHFRGTRRSVNPGNFPSL